MRKKDEGEKCWKEEQTEDGKKGVDGHEKEGERKGGRNRQLPCLAHYIFVMRVEYIMFSWQAGSIHIAVFMRE